MAYISLNYWLKLIEYKIAQSYKITLRHPCFLEPKLQKMLNGNLEVRKAVKDESKYNFN